MIKFLDLQAQYNSIKSEIDNAIASVIEDSAFVGGKYVKQFEEDFRGYTGSEYCVGVGNGTDALEIAIEASDLAKGSEIIVPGNSFIASSEAVTRTGHKVVFADVDHECYTMTAETILPHLTPETSAILVVHLYGHPCDMDPIMELAKANNLIVIEDCAQAHGTEYKGKRVGTIGHFGTFSFYPGKNLGAYGDAGAITTQNEDYAILARKIANHGRIGKYDHEFEGRSSRLDGMQAAILSTKLKHLQHWTDRRIEVADSYLEKLDKVQGLTLPVRKVWARQVYHLFVIRTSERDKLREYLAEKDIQSGIHYPIALAKLDAYKYLGQQNDKTIYNETDCQLLSLPIGEHISNEDIDYVVNAVKQFFTE